MKSSYKEWCKHYGYDPKSKEAKEDYERAKEALAALMMLAKKQEEKEKNEN